MTLAAVLALYFLSLADPSLGSALALQESAAQDSGGSSASPAQTPSAQSVNPAPAPSSGQKQTSPGAAKPSAQHRRHLKKTAVPDCSPLKTPGESNPAASTNTGSTDAVPGEAPSRRAVSGQPGPTTTTSPAPKPCPPAKVVVRNGGSKEPTVELKGDTTPEQASQQRYTTEQLTAVTEENLKKIAGRQLNPSQQEMINQIKEFMDQSKKAIAAGDVQRGHNLAVKARVLSDELVKP
jgi:hypothetical protein